MVFAAVACGDDKEISSPSEIRQRADPEAESKRVAVPLLEGTRLSEARRQLERLDLRANVRRQFSSEPNGMVLKQSPPASTQLAAGAVVVLKVSKGRRPPPPAPAKPYGILGTSGIGTVQVGTGSERVERAFGAPPRKEPVNFGGGPAPQIDWIWSYPDGELRLQFETRNGTVTGYVCKTSNFSTSSGAKVGSPFSSIRARYGDQLTESPIGGPGAWVLSEGEPGTFPALLFTVDNDAITSISGGEPQPAGE